MQFDQFGLAPPIMRALERTGYVTPTPIQQQALGPGLAGRDLLGVAQTGTGKTAAFALPTLQRLAAVQGRARGAIRALVLTPTRELAAQVAESFRAYGQFLHLTTAEIYGGVSERPQIDALRRGIDVLVATPGRLLDLMGQGFVKLGSVEVLVLDEADRMLDMGFIPDIRKIVARVPERRQTLLFSATLPREILELARGLLDRPVEISVASKSAAADTVTQCVYMVEGDGKQALLRELVSAPDVTRALVFTRTKRRADKVARALTESGTPSEAIHGNKSQNNRTRALRNFQTGATRVLVASDLASRGLDIDEVSHVFNFDLPNEPETYVHRIGRTGRAGATGLAVSFCDREEREFLRDIEKLIGRRVPVAGARAGEPEPESAPHDRSPRGRPEPRAGGRGRDGGARRGERESFARRGHARPAPQRPAHREDRSASPRGERTSHGDDRRPAARAHREHARPVSHQETTAPRADGHRDARHRDDARRSPHRESPHREAPHREASHREAPHREASHREAPHRESSREAPRRDEPHTARREGSGPRAEDHRAPRREGSHGSREGVPSSRHSGRAASHEDRGGRRRDDERGHSR